MNHRTFARRPRRRAGLTIIEVVITTLIVSGLLVAASQTAALSSVVQFKATQRATGRALADSLMAEILSLPYEDPVVAPLFGRETGETATSKVNYNDVDDFNGWTESPPQDRDGKAISNLTNWRRSVVVERINPSNVASTTLSESGAKRVTVTVSFRNVVVASSVAFRTKAP